MSIYIGYSCIVSYRSTYEEDDDTLKCQYILIPSFILACILHSSLNNAFLSDISWAFALYAEALCVLPQLIMFQNGVSTLIDTERESYSISGAFLSSSSLISHIFIHFLDFYIQRTKYQREFA